jgi:hypothetical protein
MGCANADLGDLGGVVGISRGQTTDHRLCHPRGPHHHPRSALRFMYGFTFMAGNEETVRLNCPAVDFSRVWKWPFVRL